MIYKNILYLFLVAAVSIQAAETPTPDQSKTSFFDFITDSKASIVSSYKENKAILGALVAIIAGIPALLHITDGKKFNNIDEELEALKTIINELKKSPKNTSHYKKLARQLYFRFVRLVRKTIGTRSYKITLKDEKIESENKDGSKNITTLKDEKTIAGTKLCKIAEDAFETAQKVGNMATLWLFLGALAKMEIKDISSHGKNLVTK